MVWRGGGGEKEAVKEEEEAKRKHSIENCTAGWIAS